MPRARNSAPQLRQNETRDCVKAATHTELTSFYAASLYDRDERPGGVCVCYDAAEPTRGRGAGLPARPGAAARYPLARRSEGELTQTGASRHPAATRDATAAAILHASELPRRHRPAGGSRTDRRPPIGRWPEAWRSGAYPTQRMTDEQQQRWTADPGGEPGADQEGSVGDSGPDAARDPARESGRSQAERGARQLCCCAGSAGRARTNKKHDGAVPRPIGPEPPPIKAWSNR